MRTVALYMPGEAEIDLLSLIRSEQDVEVRCVVDPTGASTGTLIAEAMGLPVHLSFRAARLPEGTTLIGPSGGESAAHEAAVLDGTHVQYVPTARFSKGLIADPGVTTSDPLPTAAVEPEFPHLPDTPPAPEIIEPVPSPEAPPPEDLRIDDADLTLDRIEDVLDRDRLLPWLLDLAMKNVGADGGSLMLLDPGGDELFIAVARGLSIGVQHSTRVPLGQGIAGRVAASGKAEIVQAHDPAGLGDERGSIEASLCLPLITDAGILGVLNLCRLSGSEPYDADHLDRASHIAHRMAAVLHRAEGVARTREGDLRHRLARHLMALAEDADDLESALAGWSGSLTMDLEAAGASVAVLREDGTLLVAECDTGGETRVSSVSQTHPAWNDVLETGRPIIARQMAADGGDELSLFFLPVGRPRLQAILGLSFERSADAHRFQSRSAAVVELLERRLPGLLRRFHRRAQIQRQQELLTYMSERNAHAESANESAALTALRVAAARIVGARRTYLVQGGELLAESAGPPAGWDATGWSRRIRELLASVGDGPWLSAGVDPGRNDDPDGCVLVAPATGHPACGLVLVGKERQHGGDSAVFTAFDAELAVRLASLVPETFAPHRGEELVLRPAAPPMPEEDLIALIRREMSRSDRYHVAFSVSAFRLPDDIAPDLIETASRSLDRLVRTSDTVHLLEDGVTIVLAPEETNAVSHLEQRVIELMRETLGLPTLRVRHGRALYPGPFQEPAQLLEQALQSLESD